MNKDYYIKKNSNNRFDNFIVKTPFLAFVGIAGIILYGVLKIMG